MADSCLLSFCLTVFQLQLRDASSAKALPDMIIISTISAPSISMLYSLNHASARADHQQNRRRDHRKLRPLPPRTTIAQHKGRLGRR